MKTGKLKKQVSTYIFFLTFFIFSASVNVKANSKAFAGTHEADLSGCYRMIDGNRVSAGQAEAPVRESGMWKREPAGSSFSTQKDTWEKAGPWGGSIYDICRDAGGTLYAGVAEQDRGIFRSTDNGANWEHMGLDGYSASAVGADSAVPGWIYCGTFDGDQFRSTDAGENWEDISSALPVTLRAIAPDPEISMKALAGGYGGALYGTTDGGDSWSVKHNHDGNVISLVYDPSDSDIMYWGSDDSSGHIYILKSTDRGESWYASSTGVPNNVIISGIAVSPTDSDRIYATWWPFGGVTGILRSVNGGQNWTTLATNRGGNDIKTDPESGDIVYAVGSNSSFSTDGGDSWTSFSAGHPSIGDLWATSIMTDPANPDTLFVALHGEGIVWSTDGGASWASRCKGMDGVGITSAFICKNDADRIGAATGSYGGGYFHSEDGGLNWSVSPPYGYGPWNLKTYALASSPDGVKIYLGDWNDSYRSINEGWDWNSMVVPQGTMRATSFAVYDVNPHLMYAGVTYPDIVHFSENSGESWLERGEGLPANADYWFALAVDPHSSDIAYAGDCSSDSDLNNGKGVYKTTDQGMTWIEANDGLAAGRARAAVWLAIDEHDTDTIYAATGDGPYRSLDAGENWSRLSQEFDNALCINVSPHDPRLLCMTARKTSNSEYSVFLSTDQGETWEKFGSGLPVRNSLTVSYGLWSFPWAAFDPEDNRKMWAAVGNSGLWTNDNVPVLQTITPSPSVSPPSTQTPPPQTTTPEPTPTIELFTGVRCVMPASHYSPGDIFYLDLLIGNQGETMPGMYLFLVLNILGDYWFFPSWVTFPPDVDYLLLNIPHGLYTLHAIEAFTWPQIDDAFSGIRFLSAIVDPEIMDIVGEWCNVEWSYGPR